MFGLQKDECGEGGGFPFFSIEMFPSKDLDLGFHFILINSPRLQI